MSERSLLSCSRSSIQRFEIASLMSNVFHLCSTRCEALSFTPSNAFRLSERHHLAFTWTGKPVKIGVGSVAKARPLTSLFRDTATLHFGKRHKLSFLRFPLFSVAIWKDSFNPTPCRTHHFSSLSTNGVLKCRENFIVSLGNSILLPEIVSLNAWGYSR